MNLKTIVIIVILGLLLGVGFGVTGNPNNYPFIIQPTPPFVLGASSTHRGDDITSDTLPTIMARPNSKTYLYLKTSNSCSDINVYALQNNQTTANTPPIKVIPAQEACGDGSFIDTEIITDSDRQITIESEEPFTYAAFQGVEGDELSVESEAVGDQNA